MAVPAPVATAARWKPLPGAPAPEADAVSSSRWSRSAPILLVLAALTTLGVLSAFKSPLLSARQGVPAGIVGNAALFASAPLAASVAEAGCEAAGGLPAPEGEVPWLRVIGGNFSDLVASMSWGGMTTYNPPRWRGKVTLCFGGLTISGVKLHTRGHISVRFPKHQFGLTLPRTAGLLGMNSSRKWVLAAPWSDTSFQRNPVAFDLYRGLGGWATQLRFVNVMFGDTDFGLYYIGEMIEPDPHRLAMPSANPVDPFQDGFLLQVDWPKPGLQVLSSALTNTTFSVRYPAKKFIAPEKEAYLQSLIDKVDHSAAFAAGADVQSGASAQRSPLQDVLDYESIVRYYILEELAKDVDGYTASDYLIAWRGKLYAAAPWDFDNAFGYSCDAEVYYKNVFTGVGDAGVSGWQVENAKDRLDNCALFYGEMMEKCKREMVKIIYLPTNKRKLFLNIWQDASFRAAFAAGWRSARRPGGPLADASLEKLVQDRAKLLAASAQRDLVVWRRGVRCPTMCCHPEDTADFGGATRHLLQYLLGRARWIDEHADDPPRSAGHMEGR